ncbi:bifunctional oligoribonuclease/PAP phosphatase NrnA [Halomicroarcula limicola]|uniref:Bifunctional oligoribonuclease/PAP phosphatase NrnA n=1 Tax=Haloarcula limicola TaxID=1429915 RepID=A0A8J7Y5E2_9EURY|nr:bifunctional oligoribonuclease/PAP phosphatase NrnA [Halomicroarcula limicola]MBV0924572.1 bifunctional oligoribonuclease/PAP phosphatase NrnA [Halomicroarcula limicola]
MPSRLVLGAGPTALALVDALSDDNGSIHVVTADEHRAETLRTEGTAVTVGEISDPAVLDGLSVVPETVIVATEDAADNAAATTVVGDLFPESFCLCYTGYDVSESQRAEIEENADRVVDPASVITERLGRTVGTDGTRARQLQRALRDVEGHLAIVTHDNPDPDAIASAVALGNLAERVGCTVSVCYYGSISHQENRAFVNLLEYELVNLDPEDAEALDPYDGFALVDHSRPGVNDQLPEELDVDVVIDHHPPRFPVEARYVDLRSAAGATSTLLVDYFQRFEIEIPEPIATGLLFGIRVDTKDFRREVSAEDFEAAAHLVSRADMDALQRIEDPSVSAETLSIIGRAIDNREQEGSVLLSCVGQLSDRDALAQAADRLLDLEDVQATMVYGVLDGTIYASARARGADIDLGEAMRDAFGQIGSAGGHADMAGAQITLGVLDSVEDREESLEDIVRSVVNDRFLDAVQSRSHRLLGSVYPAAEFGPETYAEVTSDIEPTLVDDADTETEEE